MLDVSIPSIQPAARHGSHIVWVSVSLQQFFLQVKGIMRTKAPLQEVIASTFLKVGAGQRVSYPDALLFAILA
jgi:hypothetical protein